MESSFSLAQTPPSFVLFNMVLNFSELTPSTVKWGQQSLCRGALMKMVT